MNNIDELSEKLGSIQSAITHIVNKTEAIDIKMENIKEITVEQRINIQNANKRLDYLEKTVQDHETIKNKGMGILAFVGFVFGTLGAVVGKVISLSN